MDSYYRVKQVAEKLNVNHELVRKLVGSGKLDAWKVGGAIRISETAVNVYQESTKIQKPLPVKAPVKPNRTKSGSVKWFL
jgi:excisionase family DNA binding protein